MSTLSPLRIGVLIPEEVQLLDLASVDLFPLLSQEYMARCNLPDHLVKTGIPSVKIFYIADRAAGDYQLTTAAADIRITHHPEDEDVTPGKLDIILIPGPFPPATTSDAVKEWTQAHAAKDVVFLVVCTGSFVAGNCGLFDGKLATGPRPFGDKLRELYPAGKWSFEKRWVRDGNVWSSGTIANGLDMVSAYIRENYPASLAEFALGFGEIPVRPVEYEDDMVAQALREKTISV